MPRKLSQFPVRIDSELLQKFRYIAGYHARSANREMEMLIRNYVAQFETKHGEILLEEEE